MLCLPPSEPARLEPTRGRRCLPSPAGETGRGPGGTRTASASDRPCGGGGGPSCWWYRWGGRRAPGRRSPAGRRARWRTARPPRRPRPDPRHPRRRRRTRRRRRRRRRQPWLGGVAAWWARPPALALGGRLQPRSGLMRPSLYGDLTCGTIGSMTGWHTYSMHSTSSAMVDKGQKGAARRAPPARVDLFKSADTTSR